MRLRVSMGTMGDKEMLGVRISPELMDRMEEQLEYGDTKSGWVREAIRQRLEKIECDESGNRPSQTEIATVN